MSWAGDAISALKLPPKIMAGIAIPSGFLVLAPEPWLRLLGLVVLIAKIEPYVAIVFLISTSILIMEGLATLGKWIGNRRQRRQFRKKLLREIADLDPNEIGVLREFFLQAQSTIKLPVDQPVVAGLQAKGILQRVGRYGEKTTGGLAFPYKIHEYVLPRLTDDVLALPSNPSEIDRIRINNERPHYVHAILQDDRFLHSPSGWRD